MTNGSQVTGIAIMVEKDAEPSSRSVSRTQRRASRTRKRLLDAALAMFSEKGVDATAIEDITERADVGKGTFYRHFGNKEAVVVALAEGAVSRLVDSTKPAKPPEDLEAALAHLLNAYCSFYKEHPEEFLLLFQGRLLLKLQKDAAEIDPPFAGYLKELGQLVAAFVPQPVPEAKIRRLAAALAGYPFVQFSLVKSSAPAEEIETIVQPLRRSLVAGLVALLSR